MAQAKRGLSAFWDALERLATETAELVNTKSATFRINNDTVAKEAGKKPGSLRSSRYPELSAAIKAAEKTRLENMASGNSIQANLHRAKAQKADYAERYKSLFDEHQKCLAKLMNITLENYQLRKELADKREEKVVQLRHSGE